LFGILGAVGSLLVGSLLGVDGFAWFFVFSIGIALGVLWGGKRQHESCSGCRRRVRPDDRECGGCGARLVGEIKSFDQRLAAEEEFRAAERARGTQQRRPRINRDPTSDCLTALMMAWVLKSGLTHTVPSSALAALMGRVEAGDFDVQPLLDAWYWDQQPFSEEGAHFCRYYIENRTLRDNDYAILTTASRIGPDLGTFKRFSAILDRRLGEWRERGDGAPRHAM
jgi:hypothetical protein